MIDWSARYFSCAGVPGVNPFGTFVSDSRRRINRGALFGLYEIEVLLWLPCH